MPHHLPDVQDFPHDPHDDEPSSDVALSQESSGNGSIHGFTEASSDGSRVVSMAQLQDVLSPSAYGQLSRIQNLDLHRVNYQFLEVEFADALRELEHVESVTAALFRAVLEMKRSQALHDDRIVQLEEEIISLQGEITSLGGPAKLSYKDAEGALRREQKDLVEFKIHVVERMDNMQSSLGKTERNVTVLRSQWSKHQNTVDDLVKRLFPTQDLAQFLAAQYSEMKAREDVIWSLVKQVREEVHELTRNPPGEMAACDEITGLSLEAELQDVDHYVSCHPVSSLVIDDDGWYRSSNDQLLESTVVGTHSSTLGLMHLSALTHSDNLAVLEAAGRPAPIHINEWDATVAAVLPRAPAQSDEEQDIDAVYRSTPTPSSGLGAILPLTPIPFNEQKEVDVAHPPAPTLFNGRDAVLSPCGAPPGEQKDAETPHPSTPTHPDGQETLVVVVHPPAPAHSEKGEDVNIVRPSAPASLDAVDAASSLAPAPSDNRDVVLPPAPAWSNESTDAETPHPSTPTHPDGQETLVVVVHPPAPAHSEKGEDVNIVRPSAPASLDAVDAASSLAPAPSDNRDVVLPPAPAWSNESTDAETPHPSTPTHPDGQETLVAVVHPATLAHFEKENLADDVPTPTRTDDISVICPSAPVCPDGAFVCFDDVDAILSPAPACATEQEDAETTHLSTPSAPDGQEMNINVVHSSALAPSGVPPLAPACANEPADAETTPSSTPDGQERHLPAPAHSRKENDVNVVLPSAPVSLDAVDAARPPPPAPSNDRDTVLLPPPACSDQQEEVGAVPTPHAVIHVRERLDILSKLTGDVALVCDIGFRIWSPYSPNTRTHWFVFAGSAFLVATFMWSMWRVVVGHPPLSSQYPMWDWASSKA